MAKLLGIAYVEELTEAGFNLSKMRERLKSEIEKYPENTQFKQLWKKYLQAMPKHHYFDCSLNWSRIQNAYFQAVGKPEEHDMLIEFLCYGMTQQAYAYVKSTALWQYLDDESLATDICDSLGRYMSYGDCLLKAKEYQDSKLYKACCLEFTHSTKKRTLYANVKALIVKLPEIANWTGISLEDLTVRLSKWNFPQIDDEEVEKTISIPCLKSVEGLDNKLAQGMRDRVQEYLVGRDENEWEDSLNGGLDSYMLKAVRCVGNEGCDALINAVRSYVQKLSKSREIPNNIEEWQAFINELDSKHGLRLNAIMGVVCDNLSSKMMTVPEVQFWGEWLFESRKLRVSTETMHRILTKEVLVDATCCAILVRHGTQLKHMYDVAPEDEQELFRETVKQLAQNSENHKDLLRKMGFGRLLKNEKKK